MTAQAAVGERADELRRAFADDDSFRAWYDRTLPRVYAYLMSRTAGEVELAEELTQQTFVDAVAQRHRFDGRADSVTWLCAIARNKLADHFRRREREGRRRLQLEVAEITADGSGPWRAADERAEIGRVLASLPPLQRAALVFTILDGLSVREVGRLIGRSEGATQSLVNRARENFRARYRGEAGDA